MKKGIASEIWKKVFVVLSVLLFAGTITVEAQEESGTAGSSLGKPVWEDESEISTFALPNDGWEETKKGWKFYENGQMITDSWRQIKGIWYWFEKDGYMAEGWRKIKGKWNFFQSSGAWVDSAKYKSYVEESIKGIDVSKWDKDIDWNKVKKDGFSFAFIRAGHTGEDQNIDPNYEKNMKAAEAAGLPVGVYYYSKATNETAAIKEAQHVIDMLDGELVSYPVVMDVEDKVQINLGKKKMAQIIRAFCDEIRSAGYTPMLYANENWCKNYIDIQGLRKDGNIEFWIARYNYCFDETLQRSIWQASSRARVDGISGSVDVNFGYKDYTKIVTPRRKAVSTYVKTGGEWIKDKKGWWYKNYAGGYPANTWRMIDGKYYWFDKSGYMTTGWQYVGGKWYYMSSSGAMTTGWQYVGGKWYYMNSSGAMTTGWQYVGNKWYYMNRSGAMLTGWQKIGGKWYYMNSSGQMQSKKWIGNYYVKASGEMAVNQWINGYYVGKDGCWVR